MNTRNILIGIVAVLIVVGDGVAVWAMTRPAAQQPAPVGTGICTMEAKICPDGSAVGRTGPACEFAACPDVTTTTEKESTVAGLNQRILTNGVHITPLSVVADSRCPVGVQCIWAGEVRIKAKLENGTNSETVTMVMGSPVSFGNKHVTLTSVTPAKTQAGILPGEYRFTFSVAYGMGGDEVSKGTLSGTMTIGPVCPVERVDNPCKPTPEMYAARKVAVYTADKKTLVTTLTPGADGTFSASLPPASYYVAMAAPQQGIGGATGVPTTITIKSGTTTHLTIDVDTGIR